MSIAEKSMGRTVDITTLPNHINNEHVHIFRPVKDYSPGADCKKKIYKDNIEGKYNVQFVLEDNYKCVKMWREQGLLCLQPNEGKF